MVVRTTEPLQAFRAYVQQAVRKLDKDMPVSNLEPQMEYVDRARAQTRFVTVLSGALGALALLLACIGIYGVTSYSVAERNGEIAIRIVVGAGSADVGKMVLRNSKTCPRFADQSSDCHCAGRLPAASAGRSCC